MSQHDETPLTEPTPTLHEQVERAALVWLRAAMRRSQSVKTLTKAQAEIADADVEIGRAQDEILKLVPENYRRLIIYGDSVIEVTDTSIELVPATVARFGGEERAQEPRPANRVDLSTPERQVLPRGIREYK